MKSVLILCDLFPPAFGPRMGYLCKYLVGEGWTPVVVTEQVPGDTFDFLREGVDVTYVPAPRLASLTDVFFGRKTARLERAAERKLAERPCDVVLCSTYREFPLAAARRIARRHRLPLVVDLRDIIEQYAGDEYLSHPLPRLFGVERIFARLFRARSLAIRNRALEEAKAVTTISPWHVEVLRQRNPHVHLIYNGYDPELFAPHTVRTPQFRVTYTGRLLSTAMRNPELLLRAVARLAAEGEITPETFRIRWFTDDASRRIIQQEAERYDCAPFMDYPGMVPATAVPDVLNESSVLLLLTNRAAPNGPQGIMTTKFFEALAVEKPILCVRGDEGCLEQTIAETRSGLSAHNEEEVHRFLLHHYRRWQTDGFTTADPDREAVRRFSRRAQAGQFARIIEGRE